MKDEYLLPTTSTTLKKDSSLSASLFGKCGYKFWVLSAILLLAFWSMFTGSVSLKWTSGDLARFSDDVDFSIRDDLDILEVEERKKMVRRMWDVYTNSNSIRLPRFWLEAFEAAYEYLTNDVPATRDVAVSEIARMSLHSVNFDPLPVQSNSRRTGNDSKVPDESQEVITVAISN